MRRESNVVADWLARNCDITDVDIRIIDVPYFNVRKLLLLDSPTRNDE